MISQKSIEEVIDAAHIEDIVKDYVDLKSRGSNMIGLCPFHKEKTPSFYVSSGKNIFKCFGCGKGGTPVQFLMEAEQLSFPEAIRQLAKRYQIQLEETQSKPQDAGDFQELESLHIVNQFALEFYKSNLWDHPIGKSIALSYFKQRGFLESTVQKFELGFALDQSDAFCKAALAKGFKLEFLQRLGLVNQYQKDFFRNRVMFPIHNQTGKPIAFAGRMLQSDAKVAKYVNSPETELYHKSKTLYGLHLAKKAIREKNQCILVEGYTDVMALSQSGIENVVASSGTSLTEDQIHILKRLCTNICILYDGDPAGIKAATRGIDLILQEGLNVKVALIPDNKDPDEFIKSIGAQAFEEFLSKSAVDFILFRLHVQLGQSDHDPLKRSETANEIVRTISKIPDPIRRSVYIKEAALQLKLDEQSLIESCNKLIREDIRQRGFQERRKALDQDQQILKEMDDKASIVANKQLLHVNTDEFQEKDICRVLMLYGHHWYQEKEGISFGAYIIDNISDTLEFFESKLIRKIILDISQQIAEGQNPDIQYFISHSDKEIADLALSFTLSKYEYSRNWSEKMGIYLSTQEEPDQNFYADITNAILRFKLKKYNKAIDEFEKKLRDHQLDEHSLEIELKSHQHILRERNYIAGLLKTVVIH